MVRFIIEIPPHRVIAAITTYGRLGKVTPLLLLRIGKYRPAPHRKGNAVVTVSCDTGVDPTTISTQNYELLPSKIYEKSSLDHSFFCICNPRFDADLLRDRTRHDHDHNYNVSDCCDGTTASPNATPYGRLLAGWLLIAAVPFSGADMKLTTL
jgi:hypothetical protein